jgi:uncharacterized membrane protein
MRPFDFLLVMIVESCSVGGQILFKNATRPDRNRTLFTAFLTAGIALKAVEHFMWLGLLNKYELSKLYPFDALNRIMLVAAAWFFLKERISLQTWLGVGLITVGVWIVSAS